MPKLSKKSLTILDKADIRLQKLCEELIKYIDFKVVCSYRNRDEQTAAYNTGKSKLAWPRSKHNSLPSKAIDIYPYPIDVDNRDRFIFLMGAVMIVAKQLNLNIRFGCDWNGNHDPADERFSDLPHLELV